MTRLIDAAFQNAGALQGWIANWDWIPRFSMGEENNYTPYEAAHAVDNPASERDLAGDGYMHTAWCSRHLRGISDRLWLGEPLLAAIGRDQLSAAACLTEVAESAVRIDLLPDHTLNQLEEILQPLLPCPLV